MFNYLIFNNMNEREKNESMETITNAFFASLPVWNITELNGYEPQTTFWEDFSIADKFGKDAVQDTYNRAFADWKSNVVYLTEMVLVLNHKIWQHYTHNDELAALILSCRDKQNHRLATIEIGLPQGDIKQVRAACNQIPEQYDSIVQLLTKQRKQFKKLSAAMA